MQISYYVLHKIHKYILKRVLLEENHRNVNEYHHFFFVRITELTSSRKKTNKNSPTNNCLSFQ